MNYDNHVKIKDLLDSFQNQVDEFIGKAPVGDLGDVVGRLSAELKGRNFPLSVNPQIVSEAYQRGINAIQVEHAVVITRLALAGSKNLQFSEETVGSRNTNCYQGYFNLKGYDAELLVQGTQGKVIIEPHWGKVGQTGLEPISLIRKNPIKSGHVILHFEGIQYEIPLDKFNERFPSVDKSLGRILEVIQAYVNESQNKPGFNSHGFNVGQYPRRYHVGRGI